MKIIITESQYNLLVESKIENFKKFLKDNFDFELSVKIIDQYDDLPSELHRYMPRWMFLSQINAFGPLYLIKYKRRAFIFVDSKSNGGYVLEVKYNIDNEPLRSVALDGTQLSDIFNIDDVGLDISDIIKLYV